MPRKPASTSSAAIHDAAHQVDLPGTAAPDERVSLREYVRNLVKAGRFAKISEVITWMAAETKISRGTLSRHVAYGVPLTVPIANALAAWSKGAISAAKTAAVAP